MRKFARAITKEQTIISRFPELKHQYRGGIDIYKGNLLYMADALINATCLDGHPNLVQLRSVEALPDDTLKLIHTYQPGQCLQEVYSQAEVIDDQIRPRTINLTPDVLMLKISKLLEGVQHLHSKGIIHRDICPNNILLTPDWALNLYDYETAGIPLVEDPIWRAGIGTMDFAAPEQYPDFEVNTGNGLCFFSKTRQMAGYGGNRVRPVTSEASDIFSLGTTVTEILYREMLHDYYPRIYDISDNHTERLTTLFTSHPFFNSKVGETLIQAQELNPKKRFQSVAEFEETLRVAVTNQLSKVQANRIG